MHTSYDGLAYVSIICNNFRLDYTVYPVQHDRDPEKVSPCVCSFHVPTVLQGGTVKRPCRLVNTLRPLMKCLVFDDTVYCTAR